MWKECSLKMKALERELLGTRCLFLINWVHLWPRTKGNEYEQDMLVSSLLYPPGAPLLLGCSAQTFTPVLGGVLCFETAWFTSSPRLLQGGFVTGFFSWSYSYAKAISFQWVEQVSPSCFLEGHWEADQVEAGTEKCLLTLALNVFYCKEAKESIYILIAMKEGKVTHWQNSSVCVEWSFGGLCLLTLISYKSLGLIEQSDVSKKFCFFNAREDKSCKTVSPIQIRM